MYRDMMIPQGFWHGRPGSHMKLEGVGSVMASPDMAAVTIGVMTEGMNLEKTQQENAEITDQIVRALLEMGINEKDIQTQRYAVEPQYDYQEGKQVFTGYKVTHLYRVNVRDISKTGRVIDTAVASGANVIGDIDFMLSNPDAYYRQALRLAIMDAVRKAGEVERTLDVQVNKTPVSIVEETGQGAAPQPFMLKAEVATQMQPGILEVTARIRAVFEYRE